MSSNQNKTIKHYHSTNGMAQSMEQVQVLDFWEEIEEHEARWL
jgi:hypothetical protein